MNHLHGRPYQLRGLSTCDDTRLLHNLLQQLARGGNTPYHCAASGTVARCMMVLLAVTPGEHLLTGDSRLMQRPMAELIDALNGMGFDIRPTVRQGFLPVRIKCAAPRRKMAFVDPSRSSQFVSSLLLLAPELPDGMTLVMTQRPASRPYIEMTCSLLESVGISVTLSRNGRVYTVNPREGRPRARAVTIESDWSAASFFMSAAALLPGRRLRLKGLELPSLQGDSAAVDFFAPLGVVSRLVRSPYKGRPSSVTVEGAGPVPRLYRASFVDQPDLFPAVAVTCAALGVNAHLRGIDNLSLKESDRVEAIYSQLSAMGCRITLSKNVIHLHPSRLHPVDSIDTFGDHRIAMAFAPLLLRYPEMTILHPEVVTKSFPDFWAQFERVRRAIIA
ncbi:MAG: 5-enolpyruvylshikimate-3-phosphate synthase AroA [bacterium P3]|nr:MAG: 5-enolpyruvylshikimate-3-phosphate synthase AroA [bacterium P3]KWW38982.1 MAG: 5-enolpyruvylshikimate-3-phosphate synthase AroA [bacterium F083]